MLQVTKLAFISANLSGRFHRKLLSPTVVALPAVNQLREVEHRALHRAHDRPVLYRCGDACNDISSRARANVRGNFAFVIAMRRAFPFLLPCFSIGELMVGNGQIQTGAPLRNAHFHNRYSAPYHRLIRYGLVGAALEAAPVKLAESFERRGRDNLAAGCIAAATLGRAFLQVVRIPLGIANALVDGLAALCITVLLVGMEVGLRLAAAGDHFYGRDDDFRHRQNLLDYLHVFDLALLFVRGEQEPVPDPAAIATDSPNVTMQIAKRADDLLKDIAAIFESQPDDLNASSRAITKADANLRLYCSELTDAEGLRYGLARLKTFVGSLWEADEIVYDPPELQ
jgi:hypothetical protein